jgi:TonB family protein
MGEENRKKAFSDHKVIGWLVSLVTHTLLLLFIFFLPHFQREKAEDAYEGILVSFGLPVESAPGEDGGKSDEMDNEADIPEMQEQEGKERMDEPEAVLTQEEGSVVANTRDERTPVQKKPARTTPVEDDPDVNTLDKAKDAFSQFFSSTDTGGENKQPSGDPLGEPDATVLEGISKGKGKVGGGLDERGVLYEPEIVEQSQESGRVVVRVCVDKNGRVIRANYTQKGSTTTDRELVEIAEISAKKYRFTPSTYEEQCGTITINFIVQ